MNGEMGELRRTSRTGQYAQAGDSIAHLVCKGEGSFIVDHLHWHNKLPVSGEESAKRQCSRVAGGPRHPATQAAPGA